MNIERELEKAADYAAHCLPPSMRSAYLEVKAKYLAAVKNNSEKPDKPCENNGKSNNGPPPSTGDAMLSARPGTNVQREAGNDAKETRPLAEK